MQYTVRWPRRVTRLRQLPQGTTRGGFVTDRACYVYISVMMQI